MLFLDLLFDPMITKINTKYSIHPIFASYINQYSNVSIGKDDRLLGSVSGNANYEDNFFTELGLIEFAERILLYVTDSSIKLSSSSSLIAPSKTYDNLSDMFKEISEYDYFNWMIFKFFFQGNSVFFSTAESIDNMEKSYFLLSDITDHYNIDLKEENIRMVKLMLKNIIEENFAIRLSTNTKLNFDFLKREDLLLRYKQLLPPTYFSRISHTTHTYGVSFGFDFINEIPGKTEEKPPGSYYWIKFIMISLTKNLLYVIM
jgi:hypothetical protein